MIGLRDAFGVEVVANLAEDVVVPRFLENRQDDLLGIGVGLGAREPELLRRPMSEEPVAAGVRLNLSSSSTANCFSKPSSRLSNVVMPASLSRERPAARASYGLLRTVWPERTLNQLIFRGFNIHPPSETICGLA